MNLGLQQPIGVFDAGIGSYAVAALIRASYPDQDILYLADRASFPYGAKSRAELMVCVRRAADCLMDAGAVAVVLASNAPSVLVLDALRSEFTTPLLGVFPPVAQALAASRSRHIAVLGVQSLVSSPEMQAYIRREAGQGRVEVVNASSLVALVENGRFLSHPEATQSAVSVFVDTLLVRHPDIDVCTLSSTHLPWLAPFFRQARRGIEFMDPAAETVASITPYTSVGTGQTVCLATASHAQPLEGLRAMLRAIGVQLEPHLIEIP